MSENQALPDGSQLSFTLLSSHHVSPWVPSCVSTHAVGAVVATVVVAAVAVGAVVARDSATVVVAAVVAWHL